MIKSYLSFYISYSSITTSVAVTQVGVARAEYPIEDCNNAVLYYLLVEEQWTTPAANSCRHWVLFPLSPACRTGQRSICSSLHFGVYVGGGKSQVCDGFRVSHSFYKRQILKSF